METAGLYFQNETVQLCTAKFEQSLGIAQLIKRTALNSVSKEL